MAGLAVAAMLGVPATASAGQLKAGAAVLDASWHVGASAGQYASDGSPVDPASGNYDPTLESTRRAPSYGRQSDLQVRAIVVEGPDGKRTALVKNDNYIPQDLVWRRAAQILASKNIGIDQSNLTMAITHDHSSPYYSSTGVGAWTFQDVFDIRFYSYQAERMAAVVEQAAANLKPARVGASVSHFDKTHRHSFGPQVADDGTPAGYPNYDTDHSLSVIRFDDISDAAHPKPLANIINFGLHGEFLEGTDLISADYLAPLQSITDKATGAVNIWTQNAVGTSEPERSSFHSTHDRLEFTHRNYGQAEYGARLMSDTIVDTWRDIANGTPDDPAHFVPFRSDFANGEVKEMDKWFPGPVTHPYPGVSNCKSAPAFAGDPRIPVAGLPDCVPARDGLNQLSGLLGLPTPPALPDSPVDPGINGNDFKRLGIPVPDNYGAPSFGALQEDVDVHLQAFRIGDILFTVCSCEQWADQSRNIKTRTDKTPNNEYLGWDWKTSDADNNGQPDCRKNNDGSYGGGAVAPGTGTWTCKDPRNMAQDLPTKLTDEQVERMHRQVTNPANGWNDLSYATQADSEPTDVRQIKGNYTHDDACKQAVLPTETYKAENDAWNKPCAPGEQSPSAKLGYKLTVPISMANDYNGYIATYREFQRGDHYRKALTGWGPHSSDYLSTRLVNMGRSLNGGDAAKLLPGEFGDFKVPADLNQNDARAQALGNGGDAAIAAYDAKVPDDAGTPAAVTQPPDIQRFAGSFFTWIGGSNYTDNPKVRVQRKVGADWRDYDAQAGELPITVEFPNVQGAPPYETGGHEWHWSAHFEAFASRFATVEGNRSTPAGTYRFVVDGKIRKGKQPTAYHVESHEFQVHPWQGITVEDVKRESDGTVSFRVGPRSTRALGQLSAQIGPVDYPDSYTYPAGGPLPKFIKTNLDGVRDPAAPNDPSKVEWYCTECSFRPWLDFGDAAVAKVTFAKADSTTEEVDATRSGDRWRTTAKLAAGDSAYVAPGCVRDIFDDFNGSASARTDGGAAPAGAACGSSQLPLLSVGDVRVDEGNAGTNIARFDVTLSSPRTTPVTVDYATADDSAKAGEDYEARSGTLTFAPGETTASVEVPVKGDTRHEGDERFFLNLSNASGAAIAVDRATGTIVDDDAAPPSPGQATGIGRILGTSLAEGGRCARPVGRIHGTVLGPVRLGATRAAERSKFPTFVARRPAVDRFCLDGGGHIRIGYLSQVNRVRLSRRARRGDRAVLLLTTSRHYKVRGVGRGTSVRKLRRRFRGARSLQIGRNRWYVVRGARARIVFKAFRGRVEEVGIASLRMTRGTRPAERFLRSF